MLNDAFRIGFLILVGITLIVVVLWYLSFAYQEITGTGRIVIDDFTIIGENGRAEGDVGTAVAQMLQVRLQSLENELQDAQAKLTPGGTVPAPAAVTGILGDVRLWTEPVSLRTSLFKPVDMKLSVAGVDVGGIIPWVQRGLTSRRTLHFTLAMQGDAAEVSGSLEAIGVAAAALRLPVAGADGKAPPLIAVVDRLAHEILRRYLAQDPANKLEALNPDEFYQLAEVLVNAAAANRKAVLGQLSPEGFARLLPQTEALAARVPNWPELGYLTARIADSANEPEKALNYYRHALPLFDPVKQADLGKLIQGRIDALSRVAPPVAIAAAAAPAPDAALPARVDRSSEVRRIPDSGQEASVVGQALAVAVEMLLARSGPPHTISARYIYYAARKAGGLSIKQDGGAKLKDGIDALSKEGAIDEAVWPYQPGHYGDEPPPAVAEAPRYRVAAPARLKNLDAVKQALNADSPVVASITVYQEMMNPETAKTGEIPMPAPGSNVLGGHAVVIVGYDDQRKRVKFANSWGTGWGAHGFGYLPYEYIEKFMSEAWTFRLAG